MLDSYSDIEFSKKDQGNFQSDSEPFLEESKKHHASRPHHKRSTRSGLPERWIMYPDTPRPCPRCKSTRITELVWGYVSITGDLDKRLDSGMAEMCGCCVPSNNPPKFRCRNCDTYIWSGCVYGKLKEY